eukprot:CAMPEP_0196785612 /NCGR_PEP_ID=MMETSP1104-20130614/19709_1 /TAXON_ID=33652 /ORGANISM="Cafeteria sp., Strain Caron Lab Isolate" /LENGTH=69 /DNA_ID=CAMNT_0042155917 /DNA_START=142 /DNA_END=351 /DNA_ORIENTATION=-
MVGLSTARIMGMSLLRNSRPKVNAYPPRMRSRAVSRSIKADVVGTVAQPLMSCSEDRRPESTGPVDISA